MDAFISNFFINNYFTNFEYFLIFFSLSILNNDRIIIIEEKLNHRISI
jgi:hypothetical protein